MATKKLTTTPLSAESQQRAKQLRAARAQGKSTSLVTMQSLSRKDLAATLRRVA